MKVAFIFAHPDDESYGPSGTIMSHVAAGDDVTVVSLCKGNRPGADVKDTRIKTFTSNCERMGVSAIIDNQSDTLMERSKTQTAVNSIINEIKPEIVYTHFNGDIHQDHRLVSECVMVACRPKPESSVKELLMCEQPASTEWAFDQFGKFSPNVFVDISSYAVVKGELLENYNTEVYMFPDARSVDSAMVLANQRGKQIGVSYAEAFQLVFSQRHIN